MKNRQGYFVFSLAIVIFIFACNFLQPQQRETPATFTPLPLSTTTPIPESMPTSISTAIISDSTEIKPSIKWIKYFADTNYANFKMVRSGSGSLYVLSQSKKDYLIIKITSEGEKIWEVKLNATSPSQYFSYDHSIVLDANENVYISGISDASWGEPVTPFLPGSSIYDTFNGADTFVTKIDSNGTVLWNTFLNASPCSTIAIDIEGNIFIAAGANFKNQESAFFLYKLNNDGKVLWIKDYADKVTSDSPYPHGLQIDIDGNIYLSASTGSDEIVSLRDLPPLRGPSSTSDSTTREIFLAKFQEDGTLQWSTFIGGTGARYLLSLESLAVDQYANIYVVGTDTASWGNPLNPFNGSNEHDTFLAKLDTNGNVIWNTFLDPDIFYHSLEIDFSTGNSFIAGSYHKPLDANFSISKEIGGVIVQIDPNGNTKKEIPITENGYLSIQSIVPVNDQDYYVTGDDERTGQPSVLYISLIPEVTPTQVPDETKYREGGPLVPEITTYIPTPKDISTDPLIIIINLALAFSIAVLVLPFSITLDIFLGWVHGISDRFLDWRKQIQEKTINILGLKLSREQRSYIDTLKPIAEIFNLFIVILFYGVVFSLLDPDWNIFSLKGIVLLVEMVVAYGIVGIFDDIIQWFYIRRWGTPGKFTVRITNVILAGASVIISRSIPLSPGLMFGSPEAVRIDESVLGKNRIWFLTKISLISYVVIGLLAWIPTIILDFLVQQELQVLPQTVKDIVAGIEGFMLIVFAVSLENVFIQLIGFSGGIGKKMREKNWLLWLAVWIPVAFLFLQTLLNPRNDFFNGFQSRNAFFALACMAGFIVMVLVLTLTKYLISRKDVKK